LRLEGARTGLAETRAALPERARGRPAAAARSSPDAGRGRADVAATDRATGDPGAGRRRAVRRSRARAHGVRAPHGRYDLIAEQGAFSPR
jgi:hypothetical protein